MPTENRSSNTAASDKVALRDIVTDSLVSMVAGVTGLAPPKGLEIPDFIQGQIDRATDRIHKTLAQPAAQHQGEPVAYQWRCKTVNEGSQWRHWVDCTEEDYRKTLENPGPNPRGIIREARKLYTHADDGEVERLQSQLIDSRGDLRAAISRNESLMRQLAERDALLRGTSLMLKSIAHKLDGFHRDFPGQWCGYLDRALGGAEHQHGVIEAALSDSAKPSAPVERDTRASLAPPSSA
ncbi:hypothetical protein SAMN05216487_3230 [Pseudomonas sp. UC 17F4]|uniref:hypothetical protein n=1 Tax=Pseudomonas sp. UC 17F4 TaxID=1855328 RepID=UPI00087F23C9|nr:hypothetical protein [Pseudomonas sp. UC 17F4]SDQ67954.1 hypothetical protein SAMN05216487_3230 [Pseudomonas sp. UC 17F4]